MEKEFIKEIENSVTLNVTAGKIDSFRQIERTTGTVRVYENGFVGVAGCLGEPNEEELTAKAKEALAFAIPYPCELEGPLEQEELHEDEIIPIPAFIPTMQDFLDRLGALCPKFALSNKISLTYHRTEYQNSKGRRLVSSGRNLSISLIAQNRGSGNLFDMGFGWSGDHFDAEALLQEFKREYDAFYIPATIEPGRCPVVMEPSSMFYRYFQHFVGDMVAAGASLLAGKLGTQAFSEKLTVRDDMNPATAPGVAFFDAEGCVAPGFRPTLIENGVLKGLLTTKKTAAQYGLPNLGTASAAYDGVPSLGFHGLYFDPTAESIQALVPGTSILIVFAEGGDATPDGHYATPVQMAYLLKDGEPVGRLTDIAMSGDFFDLLGKDYIGTVRDFPMTGASFSAFMMDVAKA